MIMMRGLPPLKAERGVPIVSDGPQSVVEVKTKLWPQTIMMMLFLLMIMLLE